jgi:hypothetical protein
LSDHTRARDYIGSFWARAAARGSLTGGARKLPTLLVDVALVGSSLVAAVGAVVFAVSMLVEGDHRPKVNGLQYLAIFAQPHGTPKPSPAAPAPAPALPRPISGAGPIDMTPFGSIGPVAPSRARNDPAPAGSIGAAAPTDAAGYALVAAHDDLAWLRQGMRIFAVRPGDEIPGVGRVEQIAQRGGHWTLVGGDGKTLLTGGALGAGDASSARSPFARPMIFSGDN